MSTTLRLDFDHARMRSLGRRGRTLATPSPRPTQVVNRSTTVRTVFRAVQGFTSASTGLLLLNRGNAKGSLVTHCMCRRSPQGNRVCIPVSLKDVPRALFRDRLFKFRGNTFASTQGGGPKELRMTSKNALFLGRVNGLDLPLRTGLLSIVRRHGDSQLNSAASCPMSIELVYTAGTSLCATVSGKLFQRSLLCHVGAVRVHVPPLRRQNGSLFLLTSRFLRHCQGGCGGRIQNVSGRTHELVRLCH